MKGNLRHSDSGALGPPAGELCFQSLCKGLTGGTSACAMFRGPTVEAKLTYLLELCPQTARLTQNIAFLSRPSSKENQDKGISEHPEQQVGSRLARNRRSLALSRHRAEKSATARPPDRPRLAGVCPALFQCFERFPVWEAPGVRSGAPFHLPGE